MTNYCYDLLLLPLIAPFWYDFNPMRGGNIYYRQTEEYSLCRSFHALLTDHSNVPNPCNLVIVTWDAVSPYDHTLDGTNTFQVVLATNGVRNTSYVAFIYEDIQWGQRAQVGFNAGDGCTFFTLPGALSSDTLKHQSIF